MDDAYNSSYVVFGKAGSFAASLDLSALNGTTGFRLDGISNSGAGTSVASAGDLNGDGFADLIIGAPFGSPGGDMYAGQSFVVFGKSDWSATPALDLSTLNGTNGFRLDGIDIDDRSGTLCCIGR